jgi:hypothetical protein
VTVTGSDGSSYALSANGGTQVVIPAATATYTAKATGAGGTATAAATVTVAPAAPTVTIAALQTRRDSPHLFSDTWALCLRQPCPAAEQRSPQPRSPSHLELREEIGNHAPRSTFPSGSSLPS